MAVQLKVFLCGSIVKIKLVYDALCGSSVKRFCCMVCCVVVQLKGFVLW